MGSWNLHKMLISGGHPNTDAADKPVGAWLRGLLAQANLNTAVVALAAQTARNLWALLRHGDTYKVATLAA